jgi:hypothetical protein
MLTLAGWLMTKPFGTPELSPRWGTELKYKRIFEECADFGRRMRKNVLRNFLHSG